MSQDQVEWGTRHNPLDFETLEDAKRYARDSAIMIWAKVTGFGGVFCVYPGGRVIRYGWNWRPKP